MERHFIETKVLSDESGTVSGIAWPFSKPDRMGDMIQKGAFAMASMPLPMLFGHDPSDPVGVWESGTEKASGFEVTGRLLVEDLARAKEVRALVQAGAVRGLSIGFRTKKATSRPDGGRTITDLELLEISLVTVPAHPGAKVTSAKDAAQALRLAAMLQRAEAQIKG